MAPKKPIVLIALSVCVFFAALVLFAPGGGAAKRRPQAKIKPVQIGNIEYRAPNNYNSEGTVEAWETNKLLWRKEIYFSLKMPLAEDQENFMVSMTNGPAPYELTIVNERSGQYILDTTTRKVKTVKAVLFRGSW
jgi:hypothetical protein